MKPCLLALIVALAFSSRLHAAAPHYAKDIEPFLKTYCVSCHKGNKAKARVNLESYEAMMKATRRGQKMVVPGEPDNSRLLHTLEGKAKRMPPRKYQHQPKREEITLLREWIAAGAKVDAKKDKKETLPDDKPAGQVARPNRGDDRAPPLSGAFFNVTYSPMILTRIRFAR